MTTLKTWQQTEFKTPNVDLFRDKGDYYSLDQFIPTRDLQQLKRFHGWDTRIAYTNDFKECSAVHYDAYWRRIVLVGAKDNAGTDEVAAYYLSHTTLGASTPACLPGSPPTAIGGTHKQNVLYAFEDVWLFVGSDGDVYQATDYAHTVSNVYGDGDAAALLAVRDTYWLVTTGGEIQRWDPDATAFASFFTPDVGFEPEYTIHYRDSFLMFVRQEDGTMVIYRVPDHEPTYARQLATLFHETGNLRAYAASQPVYEWCKPYALYEDDVYFSPGAYLTYDSTPSFDKLPVYVFDGNSVELVDIVDPGFTPLAYGLLTWQGRLLLYFTASGSQRIYVLTGDKFVQVLTSSVDMLTYSDIYSVAGELIMMTEESDGSGDGVQLLRQAENSVFTSSWLDMGQPNGEKYLSRLSAVVSGQRSSMEVKLEYRTERNGQTSTWQTAVANTDNVRHLVGEDLGSRFHLLQIRVTFTDDTATDPDTRLESIAATYSYGVKR